MIEDILSKNPKYVCKLEVRNPNIQQTTGFGEVIKFYLEEGVNLPPVSKERIKTWTGLKLYTW